MTAVNVAGSATSEPVTHRPRQNLAFFPAYFAFLLCSMFVLILLFSVPILLFIVPILLLILVYN